MSTQLTTGVFPFGTVYLIDPQLTLEEKRRDLENIRNTLHFNTVVLWPACSRWDAPEPGGMAFDSVDEVMDICAELGLKAVLELQGQNPSYQERPESAGIDPDTWVENPRDIRINHPQYLEATLDYMRQVVTHFKGHPALLAYDTFNEIGNESFDIWTIREFIKFLRIRYEEDIRKLNDAWCCFFSGFEQIETLPPDFKRWKWSSVLAQRDWQQFRSWNFAQRMKDWNAAIREIDPDVIVFGDALGCDTMHTRPGAYFGVTDRDVTDNSDILGLSCYANMLGKNWWEIDAWRWPTFWRSSLSAAGGKQVMISEMMTQIRTLIPWDASSMTDQVGLWSMQALFHGIHGLIYWKYRPFRRGIQVGGRGLTNFNAEPNQFGAQAAAAAEFVERNAQTLAGLRPDSAGCAILHDYNAQDLASCLVDKMPDLYTDSSGGFFRAFWNHGICPLVLYGDDAEAGIPDWVKVLAVPFHIGLSQRLADALKAFVERGGVLITENRFGLLNENSELWNHVPGGGLHEAFGMEETGFDARFTGDFGALRFEQDFLQQFRFDEPIETLAAATDTPLLTSRKVGEGVHIHASCLLGHLIHTGRDGAQELFDQAWPLIDPAITASLRVVEKSALCDVSVLVGKENGQPVLVGITNFEEITAEVVLRGDFLIDRIEGENASVEAKDGQVTVSVPVRSAVAVFLK